MIGKTLISKLEQLFKFYRKGESVKSAKSPKFVTKNVYTSVEPVALRATYSFTRYFDCTIRWFFVTLVWMVGLLILRMVINSFDHEQPSLASFSLISDAQAASVVYGQADTHKLDEQEVQAEPYEQLGPGVARANGRAPAKVNANVNTNAQVVNQAANIFMNAPVAPENLPTSNAAIPATSSRLNPQQAEDLLDVETSISAQNSKSTQNPSLATNSDVNLTLNPAKREPAAQSYKEFSHAQDMSQTMMSSTAQSAIPATSSNLSPQTALEALEYPAQVGAISQIGAQPQAAHTPKTMAQTQDSPQITHQTQNIKSTSKRFMAQEDNGVEVTNAAQSTQGSQSEPGAQNAQNVQRIAGTTDQSQGKSNNTSHDLQASAFMPAQHMVKPQSSENLRNPDTAHQFKDRPDSTFYQKSNAPTNVSKNGTANKPTNETASKDYTWQGTQFGLPENAFVSPEQAAQISQQRQERLKQAMAAAADVAYKANQNSAPGSEGTAGMTGMDGMASTAGTMGDASAQAVGNLNQAQTQNQGSTQASAPGAKPGIGKGPSRAQQPGKRGGKSNKPEQPKIIYKPKPMTMDPLPSTPVDLASLRKEAQRNAQLKAQQARINVQDNFVALSAESLRSGTTGASGATSALSGSMSGVGTGMGANATANVEANGLGLGEVVEGEYSVGDLFIGSLFALVLIWRLLALYCIYHGGQGVVINFQKRMITIYHDWLVEDILMTNVERIDVVEPAETTLSRRHLQRLLPHVSTDGIQITYVTSDDDSENIEMHTTLIKGYSQAQLQKMFDVLNQIY